MPADIKQLLELSSEEKRIIAETLWDSLSSEDDHGELSEDEKNILQERWNDLQNGSLSFSSWDEVKFRILSS